MPPKVIVYGAADLTEALFKTGTVSANQILKVLDSNTLKSCTSLIEEEDGTVKIGTAANYVKITPDGHITFEGAATVFDDLLGDITKLKVVGTGITENAAENTIGFLTNANLLDYVYSSYQLSHTFKPNSVLKPHLHYHQTQLNIPNFLIQYRWQINGQPKTTAWTNYICNIPVFTYTSGTLNQILHGAGITPPVNHSMSDILQIRFLRDNVNTTGLFTGIDLVNETVFITSADIHIEIYNNGSNTEYGNDN